MHEWASTRNLRGTESPQNHFNPRCPCGQRPIVREDFGVRYTISIHAARLGCDNYLEDYEHIFTPISIHAARVGSDCRSSFVLTALDCYFNPRCPSGQRLGLFQPFFVKTYFNPRCPSGQRRNNISSAGDE